MQRPSSGDHNATEPLTQTLRTTCAAAVGPCEPLRALRRSWMCVLQTHLLPPLVQAPDDGRNWRTVRHQYRDWGQQLRLASRLRRVLLPRLDVPEA